MRAAATELEFERAARLRDRLAAVRKAIAKQQMVADRNEDIDVIGIAEDDLEAAVQVFYVRRGRVVGRKGFVLDKVEELTPGRLVDRILEAMYGDEPPTGVPKQVLVPVEPDDRGDVRGVALALPGLAGADPRAAAWRQAFPARHGDAQRQRGVHPPPAAAGERPQHAEPALTELQDLLDLPEAPLRIECYDMAHLQGTDYVGSMVVLEDGLPNKREYRRFRVKDVPGNDDYAAMEEVLTRRLTAYLAERDRPINERGERPGKFAYPPQLLVVDGGKGQLGVARARRRVARAGRRDPRRRSRQALRGGVRARPIRPGRDPAGERGALHAAADPRRGPPLRQHVPRRAPVEAHDGELARRHPRPRRVAQDQAREGDGWGQRREARRSTT